MSERKWHCANGKKLWVKEMTTAHILNCLRHAVGYLDEPRYEKMIDQLWIREFGEKWKGSIKI
jgi:hypothetical protein